MNDLLADTWLLLLRYHVTTVLDAGFTDTGVQMLGNLRGALVRRLSRQSPRLN